MQLKSFFPIIIYIEKKIISESIEFLSFSPEEKRRRLKAKTQRFIEMRFMTSWKGKGK